MSITPEELDALQADVNAGKTVTYGGRTATSHEELEFITNAAPVDDVAAASNRVAQLKAPTPPLSQGDLVDALANVKATVDTEALGQAIHNEVVNAFAFTVEPLQKANDALKTENADLLEHLSLAGDENATLRARIAELEATLAAAAAPSTAQAA